jgi:Na+/melibiose symporter-like transporter
MGYFDGLTVSSFKTDAQGRELFFIWGKLGKGRVIPSEDDAAAVRRYLKNYYICVFIGIVPMVLFSGHDAFSVRWLATLGIFVLIAMVALMPLWFRTRAWPLADERMTYRESMSASAQAHGVVSLSILIVLGLVMVAGSLFVLLYTDETLVGGVGMVFFGAALAVFIIMLWARRRG